jgi:uncharacterized protein YcbX
MRACRRRRYDRAMPAFLSAMHVFPLKSGAAQVRAQARVEPRGLADDRRWMVVDAEGCFLTARQLPRLTLIRATPGPHGLRLDTPGQSPLDVALPPASAPRIASAVWGAAVEPQLADAAAHAWLRAFLDRDVRLVHMDAACVRRVKAKYEGRYGRDEDEVSLADAFPLLLLSQASLDGLNARLAQPVPMLRFRPNLVVEGTAPHAEDGWRRIRIGAIEFEVAKPCIRCVITTVDFDRGVFDASGEPLRTLIGYRRAEDGVAFGQNLIPRGSGVLRVGDMVEVLR